MLRISTRYISKWKLILFIGDIFIYFLSVIIIIFYSVMMYNNLILIIAQKKSILLSIGLIYLTANYIADLYDYQRDYRRWWNMVKIIFAVILGTFINIILYYSLGYILLAIFPVLFLSLMATWRYWFSKLLLPKRLQRKIAIVGAGKSGRRILQALRNRPNSGLVPVGFLDDDPRKTNTSIDNLPIIGKSTDLPRLIRQYRVSMVVVAITHKKSRGLVNILTRLSWNGIQVIDMPGLYEFLASKVPIDHISGAWIYFHSINKSNLYFKNFKWLMDFLSSILLLLLTSPLFLLIAAAIKLDSPGPVFFLQERLGYEGRPFLIIKFRTMIKDAEHKGPQWATENDVRVTRVGRLLRKFRFDELPQLLNILRGEMSFIGPRPEREVFIRNFISIIPYYDLRMLVKPGITGWAQVMYPYASSLEQTREKLQFDLFYVKNLGVFLDFAIILKTFRIVLFGKGF